jgi:outer membrane protein assembly factor BamA
VGSVILFAFVLAASSARAAAPDSSASIRGTVAPLPRGVSPVRYAARGVLFVPYAAMEAVTWPVEQAVRLNEEHHIVARLTRIPLLKGESGTVRVFFGYESGINFSIAGIAADSWDVFATGDQLDVEAGFLSKKKNVASLEYLTPKSRFQVELIGLFENKANRPFYGLGPHSADERFRYDRRRAVAEASVRYYPWSPFYAALTGYVRDADLSDPDDDPTAEEFPGLFENARASRYAGVEGTLVLDTRDNEAFSSRGVYARFYGGANAAGHDDDPYYRHYGGEVQTFVNLYRRTRALAFRAFAEGVDADDPTALPFEELPRLGGKTGQRGYARYRFADRTLLLLTAEYRYRVTQQITGAFFTDFGSVAREWEFLRLADVDPSYGFGLSFGLQGHRVVAHVARSTEGTEFFVGTERVFASTSRRLR